MPLFSHPASTSYFGCYLATQKQSLFFLNEVINLLIRYVIVAAAIPRCKRTLTRRYLPANDTDGIPLPTTPNAMLPPANDT